MGEAKRRKGADRHRPLTDDNSLITGLTAGRCDRGAELQWRRDIPWKDKLAIVALFKACAAILRGADPASGYSVSNLDGPLSIRVPSYVRREMFRRMMLEEGPVEEHDWVDDPDMVFVVTLASDSPRPVEQGQNNILMI